MRKLAFALLLVVAACGGLGPRAQLAAADQSFTVVVDRLDRSCVGKQLAAARCAEAQDYVRSGRAALDSAYDDLAVGQGTGSNLDIIVSITTKLEAILAERTAK